MLGYGSHDEILSLQWMVQISLFQRQEIHTETKKSLIYSLEIPKGSSYPICVSKDPGGSSYTKIIKISLNKDFWYANLLRSSQ